MGTAASSVSDFFLHIPSVLLYYFIIPGDHINKKQLLLDYKPCRLSAITHMSGNRVMVAQEKPPAIRIHELPSGKTVESINCLELGLSKESMLHGIRFTGERMHLVEGNDKSAESIHTYKVKYNLFKIIAMHSSV